MHGREVAAVDMPRREEGGPEVVLLGEAPALIWELTTSERAERIARKCGLQVSHGAPIGVDVIVVNCRYVFDPFWLDYAARNPGTALTLGDRVVLAHCRTRSEVEAARRAIEKDTDTGELVSMTLVRHEDGGDFADIRLRKREQPFAVRLTVDNVRAVERISYYAAYKGVTDLLTKYLWPEWALFLTRIAAKLGISPNMVTTVGAANCVLATFLFWYGHYWLGMAAALVFMVLDTVDGKLARCTITSSKWGNIFDHGIDIVHPPFWWYAWGDGLTSADFDFDPTSLVMQVIIGGYLVQRLIEGVFMRVFKMHIHVWRKIDSQFRLVTARRNPNMILLFGALLIGRPDLGLVWVAAWTAVSCLFHAVRLAQAFAEKASSRPVLSWL